MRPLSLSALFLLALAHLGLAQSTTTVITVRDAQKQPLIGATVQIVRLADSSLVADVTDLQGTATFRGLGLGPHAVEVGFIGYQTLQKALTVKAGTNKMELTLRESALELGEVTVTARRPLIRQQDDMTIIDPEPLVDISTNTLEVLEATPGVFVDQDGVIYLGGTAPAVVYINGREQRMGAQDVANILRSLPPGSIQRIEVLRTPSTKYDAASTGGIVNVVLKKGVKIGRTGTVRAGFNQGVYGNQYAGLNLNDSGEKTSYYLNLNLSRQDAVEDLAAARILTPDSILRQVATTRTPSLQGFVGLGANHDATDRLNLSYDARLNTSRRLTGSRNFNFISTPDGPALSENDNVIDNRTDFLSVQQDLGALLKIDTLGSEWDTKFSFSYSRNDNQQDYSSEFLSPFPFLIEGDGDNLQQRRFYLFQSDLTYRLPWEVKLETGLKATWLDYDSRADYFIGVNGNRVNDLLRTNAFRYREGIGAAYAQASKGLPGGLLLKVGLRVEHTYMDGRQTVPADTNFLVNRTDPFPYAYLSRKLFGMAGFELRAFLIYRKTISRPGYQSLNPYVRYIDQYLYEVGNPALRPQFTENVEMNISVDDMPIFAIGRNYTTDIFSSVVYQDPVFDQVLARTFDNVGRNRETYFRLFAGIPPGGKYFFAAGGIYNLNEYDGLYEGQPLSFIRGSWQLFTFHSLSITKQTKLNMSGFMLLNGQQNFYELDTFGQLNFSLTQTLLNKKLRITLNARDVLRTMETSFRLQQGNVLTAGSRYNDAQRFGVNIQYSLGIKPKEEQRNMMQMDAEQ